MRLSDLLESVEVIAYHGTNHDIKQFKGIVYFTTQRDAAEGYARGKLSMHKSGVSTVYEVKLSFSNPIYYKTMQQIGTLTQADVDELKKKGYDGAIYDGSGKEPVPEYLPFYPEKLKIHKTYQIKS